MSRRKVHPLAVPLLVALFITAAWTVGSWWKIPSYVWETEGIEMPAGAKTVTVKVRGMECRHASLGLKELLFGREDRYAVKGYLKTLLFPSPGAGDMVVTWDPAQASLRDIARAVKYDRRGQETAAYRVLLEIKPDLSSPAALFASLTRAFNDRHEELFRACHAPGALGGVDFEKLIAAYGDLFLEGFRPRGEPDAAGLVAVQAISAGAPVSLREYGIPLEQVKLERTARGWMVADAKWQALYRQP